MKNIKTDLPWSKAEFVKWCISSDKSIVNVLDRNYPKYGFFRYILNNKWLLECGVTINANDQVIEAASSNKKITPYTHYQPIRNDATRKLANQLIQVFGDTMNILDKVKFQRLQARKNNDSKTASLLTTLLGEFERQSKSIGDQDAAKVILKMKSNTLEIIKAKVDQNKSVQDEENELEVLSALMPQELDVADLEFLKETSSHIGEYMRDLKDLAKKKGRVANMKEAKRIWEKD